MIGIGGMETSQKFTARDRRWITHRPRPSDPLPAAVSRRKRIDLRGDTRLDAGPRHCHQRDGPVEYEFVVVMCLDAECRTALAETLDRSTQSQTCRRWNGAEMLDMHSAPYDHLHRRVDVQLHFADADGLDNRDQVSGRQTFDQRLRVFAAMRQPREQRPCRLVMRHRIGFFKTNFADALLIHGDVRGEIIELSEFERRVRIWIETLTMLTRCVGAANLTRHAGEHHGAGNSDC